MTAIQYISQLGSAAARSATDLIPVTQGSTGALTGTTRKMTVDQLFTSPAFTGTTTLGNNLADYLTVTGAANTGVVDTSSPTIQAAGTATVMDVKVLGKGTGGRLNAAQAFIGASAFRPFVNAATIFEVRSGIAYSTTAAQGFLVGGGFSGTVTSGQAFYHAINVNSDTVDPTTGSGPLGTTGMYFGHTVSAGAKGGRTAQGTLLSIAGAITASSLGVGSFYTAAGATAQASASAGGSAGFGNGRGNLFGRNSIVNLLSGATFWNSDIGDEITIGESSGSRVYYKNGFQIVLASTDAVAGTGAVDSGLMFVQQTGGVSPGWDTVISIGHPFGWWPAKSTGTLIGTNTGAASTPSYAAAYGVDFRAVTFSTAAFASTGFTVDPTGIVTTPTLIFGGGPRIVTGAGAPPVSLTLAKGSLYIRVDGGVGSTIYVSQGGGTWNAIAGV